MDGGLQNSITFKVVRKRGSKNFPENPSVALYATPLLKQRAVGKFDFVAMLENTSETLLAQKADDGRPLFDTIMEWLEDQDLEIVQCSKSGVAMLHIEWLLAALVSRLA